MKITQYENRPQSPQETDTSPFDRCQLEMLTQVAKSHQGRHQNSQRQGNREHVETEVEKQFREYGETQVFTDEIVEILEHVLYE